MIDGKIVVQRKALVVYEKDQLRDSAKVHKVMLLNTLRFATFFIIVAIAYFITPYRFRWAILLAGSYYFYIAGSKPEYILILLLSTVVSYFCGIRMGKKGARKAKKPYLILSIFVNLGLLAFFKYLGFFGNSIGTALEYFNLMNGYNEMRFLVPLGISFYTLQTISYLVDVYRGDIEPEKHLGYLALYVSFFPTMLAGPIERGTHLLPQLHGKFDFDYDRVTNAIKLIAWGVFLKIVIADRLGIYVDRVYGDVHSYKGLPLLFATLFFAVQIYCDFAGYTNMVRGCAAILGYDLLENFNKPYFSKNIQEFWHRWHMSLTGWLRDYLYIPLGGNRVNRRRLYLNTMIVFLISGLWHGASWTFVIWGALHGLYFFIFLAMSQFVAGREKRPESKREGRLLLAAKIVITFCLVDFAWIFFRANSVSDAAYVIKNMFSISWSEITQLFTSYFFGYRDGIVVLLFMMAVGMISLRGSIIERISRWPIYIRWPVYYMFILTITIYAVPAGVQFIYRQF
jgi:alginate O-acetyltransferase complex protein AlgI